MGIPIPEITFGSIVKHPLTYALILFGLAAGYMLNQFVGAKKDQNKDCQQEVVYWKGVFTTERNINLQITNELLYEREGLQAYKDSTKKTDSLVRANLTPKSLKILKKPRP